MSQPLKPMNLYHFWGQRAKKCLLRRYLGGVGVMIGRNGDYSFLQEASKLTVIRCTLSSFHSANSLQQQLCYHFYCREHGAFRLKNSLPRDSERKLLTKIVSGSGCRCRIWDLERNKLERGKDLDYFINSCSMFLLFSLIKKKISMRTVLIPAQLLS